MIGAIWHEPAAWAIAYVASAALAIWGKDPRRMPVHWVFKPLTTALLIPAVLVFARPGPIVLPFVIGLCLAIAGDAVLMGPPGWLKGGLVCFLGALISYAIAFSMDTPITGVQILVAPIPALVAFLVLRTLWPHLGKLRPAVAVYGTGLALVIWRALARWDTPGISTMSWLAVVVGATLFMTGDTLLARHRFAHRPVWYPLELGTYYAAQACLTVGVVL